MATARPSIDWQSFDSVQSLKVAGNNIRNETDRRAYEKQLFYLKEQSKLAKANERSQRTKQRLNERTSSTKRATANQRPRTESKSDRYWSRRIVAKSAVNRSRDISSKQGRGSRTTGVSGLTVGSTKEINGRSTRTIASGRSAPRGITDKSGHEKMRPESGGVEESSQHNSRKDPKETDEDGQRTSRKERPSSRKISRSAVREKEGRDSKEETGAQEEIIDRRVGVSREEFPDIGWTETQPIFTEDSIDPETRRPKLHFRNVGCTTFM